MRPCCETHVGQPENSLHADYTYPDSVMYPYPHRAPIMQRMHSHVFYNMGSLVLQKNSWFHDACAMELRLERPDLQCK